MKILFATGNKGKLKEIRDILTLPCFEVISSEEAGIDIDVIEDGLTFEENAIKKASEIKAYIGGVLPHASDIIVMADDSGLEIDYLNKEPGVYSARYMGQDTAYEIKNKKIIELMKDVPLSKRTARFVCVIAAALPGGEVKTAEASIEGVIAYEPKGINGFGYDPIFYVAEYQMTIAEMDSTLKNKISHRGKALRIVRDMI